MQISGVDLEDLEYDSVGSWPPVLRRSIIGLVAIVTLYVGYTFYLSDLINTFSTTKAERVNEQQVFVTAYEQSSNLEQFRKQVVEVKYILDSLTQQVPRNPLQAELLDTLSQLALSAGLSLKAVKPGDSSYQGFYYVQPLELTLVGDYKSFGKFLADVSSMTRIVTVGDFDIKSSGPKNPNLEIVITLQSY